MRTMLVHLRSHNEPKEVSFTGVESSGNRLRFTGGGTDGGTNFIVPLDNLLYCEEKMKDGE